MRRHLVEGSAARLFAAYWGSLLLVDLTHGVRSLALPAVALLVAALSTGRTVAVAVCVAVIGWLFVTGFAVNSLGELRVTGPADGVRVAVLLAGAMLGRLASRHVGPGRGRR